MQVERRLSSRASGFTESVIREMTRKANTNGAINLAQGFPDFPAPDALKEAACQAIRDDHNQYAITWGSQRLREALAAKVARYNGMDFDPESEVTVGCGATEAMIASMLALVDPGDEVVVIEPFYENYGPDTAIAGATPVFVNSGAGFAIDEDELGAAFGPKTRAIVLNTPNNPTGRVYTRSELLAVADLCIDHNAYALVDEIYEHILYDGNRHVSLGSLPGMEDRTVTIGSFSKTYSVTGWRVGYALADRRLSGAIRKVHDFLTVGAPAPLQEACAAALDLPDAYYNDLAALYDRKRRLLHDGLTRAGMPCDPPEGAYYLFCDISGFDTDDLSFANFLVEQIGIAAVPGSSFFAGGGSDRIRFTFSKRDETLAEACTRLERLREM
jgi:L-glutamine---4-(methylsulfanyl)-2-oxobutanoate aminotransferase